MLTVPRENIKCHVCGGQLRETDDGKRIFCRSCGFQARVGSRFDYLDLVVGVRGCWRCYSDEHSQE